MTFQWYKKWIYKTLLSKTNAVGDVNELKKADGNVSAARAWQKRRKQNLSIIFEHFWPKFTIFWSKDVVVTRHQRFVFTPNLC